MLIQPREDLAARRDRLLFDAAVLTDQFAAEIGEFGGTAAMAVLGCRDGDLIEAWLICCMKSHARR